MKVLKLNSLFLGLLAMSLGTWSTANAADVTVSQTFEDTYHGAGNWNAKFFSFSEDNMTKIADGLGLSIEDMKTKAGSDVKIYSVTSNGTLVDAAVGYAGNNGGVGDWHTEDGYSKNTKGKNDVFYHVVKYSDFTIGMGQGHQVSNKMTDQTARPYGFKLIAKCESTGKSVDIYIDYLVNVTTTDLNAGDYSISLPYGNTSYACSYFNIDNEVVASKLGTTVEDLKSAWETTKTGQNYTNNGTIKIGMQNTNGAYIFKTNAGDSHYIGYWMNKTGQQHEWGKEISSIYYVYDPDGRIGIGQFNVNETYGKGDLVKAGDKINFTVLFKNTVNNKFATVNVTYNVTEQNYTLTTADKDFYSLNLGFAATIPAGIEAYTGSLDETNNVVKLNQITTGYIPANTSVLVKSENPGEYTFVRADKAETPVADNVIKGVLTDTKASLLAAEGKTVLQFGIKDGVVGFRLPTTDGVIKANRAYILVDNAAAAKPFSIEMGNEATGITTVKGEKVDNVSYNIAGQRVNNNANGLVIRGGKKFFNK